MAWIRLSSVIASANCSSFLLATDEEDGRATCLRGSTFFRRGMATIANFLGAVERLTMKTFQRNGLLTSICVGPENETVTPNRAIENARSRKELLVDPGIPDGTVDVLGVIGRLAGRLFRCIA